MTATATVPATVVPRKARTAVPASVTPAAPTSAVTEAVAAVSPVSAATEASVKSLVTRAAWNFTRARSFLVDSVRQVLDAPAELLAMRTEFMVGSIAYRLAQIAGTEITDATLTRDLLNQAAVIAFGAAPTVKKLGVGQAYRTEAGQLAYMAAKTAWGALLKSAAPKVEPPKKEPKRVPSDAGKVERQEAIDAAPEVGSVKGLRDELQSFAARLSALKSRNLKYLNDEMAVVIEQCVLVLKSVHEIPE